MLRLLPQFCWCPVDLVRSTIVLPAYLTQADSDACRNCVSHSFNLRSQPSGNGCCGSDCSQVLSSHCNAVHLPSKRLGRNDQHGGHTLNIELLNGY